MELKKLSKDKLVEALAEVLYGLDMIIDATDCPLTKNVKKNLLDGLNDKKN